MSILESTVAIRHPVPGDISFVFNSWLKSYRNSPWAKPMHNNTYYTCHHALVQDLLNNSDIFIACSKSNGTEIYGYAVGQYINEVFTLHYIYVKHTFRKMGIGSLLMQCFERPVDESGEPLAGCYTHHTKAAEKLSEKVCLMYNPYLLTQIEQEDLIVEGLESAVNEDPLPVEFEPEPEPKVGNLNE